MDESERRVWLEEGLLVWDGRVLELFRTDGKQGNWRVHAAIVEQWELEQRRGVSLLKVHIGGKHYESVLVRDQDVAAVHQIMAEVEEVRGGAV